MSFRTKFILILLSATLTVYTVVGGWISTRAQQPANDPNAQLRIFESVLQHIQNDYVDEPNMDKVRAGALRGLAYGLDPYSTYLTPEQVKEYSGPSKDNQVSIGAELSQVASYLYVIAPIKGSPADQAGIRPGDIIEYIDGKATRAAAPTSQNLVPSLIRNLLAAYWAFATLYLAASALVRQRRVDLSPDPAATAFCRYITSVSNLREMPIRIRKSLSSLASIAESCSTSPIRPSALSSPRFNSARTASLSLRCVNIWTMNRPPGSMKRAQPPMNMKLHAEKHAHP